MGHSPIIYHWDGECMKPLGRFARLADRQYVVGENYRLEVVQERSPESHRHYFACINEAWQNVPEIHANRWRTPDHLRRWALIQSGFCDEATFICASKAEALRLAGFLGSMDEFAEVEVQGNLIARRVAKSQDYKSMSRQEFQASKDGVLDVLGRLIGIEPAELSREVRRLASPSTVPAQGSERERVR